MRFVYRFFIFTANHCVNLKAIIRYESTSFSRIVADKLHRVKLGSHDALCLTDSFVLTLDHFVNFKPIRYELTSLSRIVAEKLHRITLA